MARNITVDEETYLLLRRLAEKLGLGKSASAAARLLARAASAAESGPARYVLIFDSKPVTVDLVRWRDYAGILKRLVEAREELARCRRALSNVLYGAPATARRVKYEHPEEALVEAAEEARRRACESFIELLAEHGILKAAREYIRGVMPSAKHYIRGRRAYYLLGMCSDYILSANNVPEAKPPRILEMD